MDKHERALQDAINYFGSQSALARALKIKRNQVNNWRNRGDAISFEYAIAIEWLTYDKVNRYDLAPYARWLKKINPTGH